MDKLDELLGADIFTDAPECEDTIERLCQEARDERDALVNALKLAHAALMALPKTAVPGLPPMQSDTRAVAAELLAVLAEAGEQALTPLQTLTIASRAFATPTPRVAVVVRGGAVREVCSDQRVDLLIVDCDTEGGDAQAHLVDDDGEDVPCNPSLWEVHPSAVARYYTGRVLKRAPTQVTGQREGGGLAQEGG